MKNSFYFVLGVFTCFPALHAFSQQQPYPYQIEVQYKLTSQPDSTDKQSTKQEFVSLLIGDAQSLYCATQYLVVDSAITAELSKGNSFGPPMTFFAEQGTKNHLVIFKDTTSIITFDLASKFLIQPLFYKEPKSLFTWIILDDTLSIGGIHCQKATAEFGGRKWAAWFAPSIPISEGLYKFNGLPGLILKLNDTQHYWNFDLASIRSVNKNIKIFFWNKTPQPVKNKEAFFSKKKYNRDNRFQLMKLQGGITWSDPIPAMKMYEEDAKKDNNWIEPYRGK